MAPARPAPLPLLAGPSPVHELSRLARQLDGPRLLIKRDDAIGFAFGGNKVRKLAYVAAAALEAGADTLITCGGVQSNHARVTAITAATLGLRAVLVVNGTAPERPTGNALLDRLAGAEIRYVVTGAERAAAMDDTAAELRRQGRRPYVIPLGASVPLGALGFADAVTELFDQIDPPDVIVHATSSGGTQAGLVAGVLRAGAGTRVVGISADEASGVLEARVRDLVVETAPLAGVDPATFDPAAVTVDDRFIGGGYGVPTPESTAAIERLARTEGIFLDPVYTAKAMAGLIAAVERRAFATHETVLFWHTGGQVALFA